jgi:hypothetical protein
MSLDGVQLAALRTRHQAPPADLLNRIQTAYVSHTQPGKPPLSWLVFLAGILSSPNRLAPIQRDTYVRCFTGDHSVDFSGLPGQAFRISATHQTLLVFPADWKRNGFT